MLKYIISYNFKGKQSIKYYLNIRQSKMKINIYYEKYLHYNNMKILKIVNKWIKLSSKFDSLGIFLIW